MKITADHVNSGFDTYEFFSAPPNSASQRHINRPADPWQIHTPGNPWAPHHRSKNPANAEHHIQKRDDAATDMELDDEKVISQEVFDGKRTGNNKKRSLTPLSAHPDLQDRIMTCLDDAITTVRDSLDQIDRHWNPKTLSKMKELFGDDVKSDDVRSDLRKKLENTLSVLENMRSGHGKDIFIESSDKSSLAFVIKKKSGYSGQTVFTQHGLNVVDDKRIVKTLIHEASHIGNNSNDNWYVRPDDDGNYIRKPPSGSSGFLHPLRSNYALNNADTVAYSAQVLADNAQSYHDELGE